jgi:hypothetical protein
MVRRLVAVVIAGVLGVGGLSACRFADNGTALYVGDTRYSEASIDRQLAAYEHDAGTKISDANRHSARRAIIEDLVFVSIARRYVAEQHLKEPAIDYAPFASQLRLPASDPFLRIFVEAQAFTRQLIGRFSPGPAVTDAQYREIYQRLRDQQLQADFATVKAALAQHSVGPAIALRDTLVQAERRYGVDINPKYGSVEFPLAGIQTSGGTTLTTVALPLSTPPVADAQ